MPTMAVLPPIIDASWHRLPEDSFGAAPSSSTPLDPTSSISPDTDTHDDDSASDWSYEDSEELVTLDLGTDRVARRALLGYSGGLDYEDADAAASATVATGSARTIRTTRATDTAAAAGAGSEPQAASSAGANPSGGGSASRQHMGAGKLLSITGLETASPLMKIGDTVLRGRRMDLLGTEIVLADHVDLTRPKHSQHSLAPLAPTTSPPSSGSTASTQSSTTRTRLMFRPIYDPSSRITNDAASSTGGMAALRALAKPGSTHVTGRSTHDSDAKRASLAQLMRPTAQDGEPLETSGRGKYKRKEISEEEQMIRAAERKIRKAAKVHFRQQQQQQQPQQQPDEQEDRMEPSQRADQPEHQELQTEIRSPSPPPPFDQT